MSEQGDMQNHAELTLRAERDDARLLLETWQSNYKELSAKNGNEIASLRAQLAEARRTIKEFEGDGVWLSRTQLELEQEHYAKVKRERDAALARVKELEHKIEDAKNPAYCIRCGSCGEDGCCPRTKCLYGDEDKFKAAEKSLESAQAEIARIKEAVEPFVRGGWEGGGPPRPGITYDDFMRLLHAARSTNPTFLKDRLDEARAGERESIAAQIEHMELASGLNRDAMFSLAKIIRDQAAALRAANGNQQ